MDTLDNIQKQIDELKTLHPVAHARFMELRQICSDSYLKCFDDLTSMIHFLFFSSNTY